MEAEREANELIKAAQTERWVDHKFNNNYRSKKFDGLSAAVDKEIQNFVEDEKANFEAQKAAYAQKFADDENAGEGADGEISMQ